MKTNIYYVNICKHEHEKNITKLWCKIVPKTNVENIKGNERSYFYLHRFRDLAQCEELLHTFTTKICTHNKNPVGSGTIM